MAQKKYISGLLLLSSFFTFNVNALELANEPLAIQTEGVSPNIMIVVDDSGSMSCYSGNCGDDVFYAPGYRNNLDYSCSSGNIIQPISGEEITLYISKRTIFGINYTGTPYFEYDGNFYGWGPSGTAYETGSASSRVCFAPEEEYQIKLKAADCSNANYCVSDSSVETFDGNFLNWYFSGTIAEWSDNTASGGFMDYSGSHWNERVASDFLTTNAYYYYSNNSGSVYPEYTELNGSDTNANNKTWFPLFPRYTNTNNRYVGRHYNDGSHRADASSPAVYHNHSGSSQSMIGMKPGVTYNQFRLNVAKDVAKQLIRDTDDAFIAVSTFATRVVNNNGTYEAEYGASGGRHLAHGFVEVDSDDPVQSELNKDSLIKAIDLITGESSTPTSETMVAAARYFFTGWENTEFDYLHDQDDSNDHEIDEVLGLEFYNLQNNQPPGHVPGKQHITEAKWCQKNAMAVLTDGVPSSDTSYAGSGGYLKTYDTVGAINEPVHSTNSSNTSGLVRVPGALYDHDFLPGLQGTQNIESFMIAFGAESVINRDDFKKAGQAGGGGVENFYAASRGDEVVSAFQDIISKVTAASASVTAVAVSSVSELQADNLAFQATYDTEFWSSSLKALNVNQDGQFVNPNGSNPSDTSQNIIPEWEANDVLSHLYIVNDSDVGGTDMRQNYLSGGFTKRVVYTWDGKDGIRFGSDSMSRPASPTAAFKEYDDLPKNIRDDLAVLAGTDKQELYDLMAFLMGDVTHEEGSPVSGSDHKFRQRGIYIDSDADGLIEAVHSGGILGDIVHSSPVYVQKPPRPWDDVNYGTSSQTYSDFKEALKDRPATIYVGANDGFLHAFTVEGGTRNGVSYPAGAEIFNYLPTSLSSTDKKAGLHYLASTKYEHRYYNDLTVTPSDVFTDFYSATPLTKPEWRTVLVGGLRAGGKGLYALDVTCPFKTSGTGSTCDDESFSEKNVLWEFSDADDSDLGYTFGDPVIAKVNYSVAGNTKTTGRWAAIVSNGYNSTDGRAALYIIFLDGGLDGSWTENKDYIKIYASNASEDNITSPNGLSSPSAIDYDGDGLMDKVYAGDLKGQLWAFDLSEETKSTSLSHNWTVDKLFTTGKDSSSPQPITSPPMVARDGNLRADDPNVMVVFGTGQYLQYLDIKDDSLQTIYAVHDRGVYDLTRYQQFGSLPALEPRIFTEEPYSNGVETIINRYVDGDVIDWGNQFGWYVELASDIDEDGTIDNNEILGERQVFRPFIANQLFIFNTIIPQIGTCTGATNGWTMLIDWTTGLAPPFPTYDANLNGQLDTPDIGAVGYFNEAAGSELGRGGDNIYDSTGDDARRKGVDFGSLQEGSRLGWEEKRPYGVIRKK